MKDLVVGIDAGTSAIKAAVISGDGKNLGSAQEKVSVDRPEIGHSCLDMNALWEAVAACIRSCLRVAGATGEDIAAVCCAGQGDGAWMIDKKGRPLGKAVLWNDIRAGDIIAQWEASGVLSKVYSKTATVLWPGSMAGILAWFRDKKPGEINALDTVFCCKDWINYCLTGEKATDTSDGTIPFTNITTRVYDQSILQDVNLEFLETKLAPVKPSASVIGVITQKAAEHTCLKAGTPVMAGLLDVAANAIGAGAVSAGQALLILGTTSLVAASLDRAPGDNRNVGAAVLHAVEGLWLRAFGAQSGSPNIDWMANVLNILKSVDGKKVPDFIAMDEMIAQSPPGSGGVLYHPFLGGERAPFLEPNATSGFFGITATTEAGDLCRSVYEGVAFSAKHCLSEMDFNVQKISMTGGGAHSDLWRRIIADVMNCEIVIPQGEELGILGAAITAGVGAGLHRSYREAVANIVKEKRHYYPDKKNSAIYGEIFPMYHDLIGAMRNYWNRRKAFLDKKEVL
jgi:sugar (pentulose or hexulose) kinase